MSALLATALTGCGSDNGNNNTDTHTNPKPDATKPDATKPDTTKPDTTKPDTTKPDTTKPEPKPDTTKPGTTAPTPVNPKDNDPVDNVGDAALPGQQSKSPSVVGQQYVRGSSAKFDLTATTNKDPKDTGNATVVGFEPLQNKKMTNIVVAQYADKSVKDSAGDFGKVKYLLGANPTANPNVNDANSIQNNNDAFVSQSPFVYVTKTQNSNTSATYSSSGQEAKVQSNTSGYTQTPSNAQTQGVGKLNNDVRVFGALATLQGENISSNSKAYYVKNSEGNAVLLKPAAKADQWNESDIKLNNVQYGRVTGALDNLKTSDITGKTYITAQFANNDFDGNKDATNVYFYRGLNETTLAQMKAMETKGGKYQYAGHALMYGIDNSYSGPEGTGLSNSVAYGTNGKAIGNFVQATYDAGNKTVEGTVYNIWDKDINKAAKDKVFEQVDLVAFRGEVVGNSVVNGTADRTYIKGNDKAAFKGSFYGSRAEELGGSFNSVTKGYDKAEWGGVFGAKQLEKKTVTPTNPVVPPINAVE